MSSEQERATVLFSGTVQGVGFRYTVQRIAKKFAVRGYVRNLADGRVELIAEGLREEIEIFIAEINSRMSRYISDVHIEWNSSTGEFSGFGVAF